MYNRNQSAAPVLVAGLAQTRTNLSHTAQCAAQAILLADQHPEMAIASRHRALRGMPSWLPVLSYRDNRRPALNWMQRLSLRLQDALDDTRSELASAVTPGLATSSVARAVSGWLANSRWLHVGPYRTKRSIPQRLVAPNPLADSLCHLPKVTLAILLRGGLRLMRNYSWQKACADAPNDRAEARLPDSDVRQSQKHQ
jgi:hypothetical protein